MKKRLLSLAMAAVMTFGTSGTLPLASFADSTSIVASAEGNEYKTKEGTYTYRILDDGTAEITLFVADSETDDGYYKAVDAVIPSVIDGHTVTSIATDAFDTSDYNGNMVASITIPETIEKIDYRAFCNVDTLSSINVDENNKNYCSVDGVLYNKDKTVLIRFPQSKYSDEYIEVEGGGAYVHPGFTVPEGVEHLASWSFAYCMCSSIDLAKSLKSIGAYAFTNAYVSSLIIPDGVRFIGFKAFDGYYIENVTIPESVLFLGCSFYLDENKTEFYDLVLEYKQEYNDHYSEYYWKNDRGYTFTAGYYDRFETTAFTYSSNLKSITVDSKNKYYSSYDGVLYNKDRTEIYYIPDSKTELSIPKEVKSINIDSLSELKKISVDKENESYTVEDSILYSKDKKELLKCPKFLEKETVIIRFLS